MRIALIGYGRMGRMLQSLIYESSDTLSAIIDPYVNDEAVTSDTLSDDALGKADVAIDFSSPDSIMKNIAFYTEHSVPAVIGTTGWNEKESGVKEETEEKGGKLIASGNFSIGVSVFLKLAEKAGEIINNIPCYDVSISEAHHRGKADAPSGTALMAAEKLLKTVERKKSLQIGNPDGRITEDRINISSVRVGSVPGIHTVLIDSSADTIEITHTARSREGFAEGALRAARWLISKPAGFYTMDDFVSDLLGGI